MVVSPLQETLHNHKFNDDESYDALKDLSDDPESNKVAERNGKSSLLNNWPLISSIIVYCVFSLHDMAYTEVSRLFFFHILPLSLFWPMFKIFSFISWIDLFIVGKQSEEIWRFGILHCRCWFCSCLFRLWSPYLSAFALLLRREAFRTYHSYTYIWGKHYILCCSYCKTLCFL